MSLTNNLATSLQTTSTDVEIVALDNQEIATLLAASPNREVVARIEILSSASEKLWVICPQNAVLDLESLNSNSQVYRGFTPEQRGALASDLGVEELGIFACGGDFRAITDSRLLSAETLYLPSGQRDQFVKLNAAEFNTYSKSSEIFPCSIPLADIQPNLHNGATDQDQISMAVRNYTSLRIQKSLAQTLEMPPISSTTEHIINLSANPNADAEKLVEIVDLDPSLSAQVVGWAASPYYSAPGAVRSIQDAIVRVLGFDLVMNLAMGLSLGKVLRLPEDGPTSITPYWRQSIYCALTMERLNKCIPPERRGVPGLTYLTGLLNNFGYLILSHVFPSHFSQFCRFAEVNSSIHPSYLEHHILGITRDQICGQVMSAWNLPDLVCNALRFQGSPEYEGDDALYPNLCFVAKGLLAAAGVGDIPVNSIPSHLYRRLELEPCDTARVLDEIMEMRDEIERMSEIFPH